NIAAVILAAGKGSRFGLKDKNKVTLLLGDKPIILYTVDLFEKIGLSKIFLIVGFAKESVQRILAGHEIDFIEQKEQKGTGHALNLVLDHMPSTVKHLLVTYGDDPFHTEEEIKNLIAKHKQSIAAITFSASTVPDPTGLGRIVRDSVGNVKAIVEEKDASEEQKQIHEVNGGCYIFTVDFLREYFQKLNTSNAAGEYYLTDLIEIALQHKERVETITATQAWKNINTPKDLEQAQFLIKKL